MPIDLTPVSGGKKERKPLEDISPDVIQAVDEAYEWGKENPQRLEANFGDQAIADDFLADARSYAYQRPDGRLVIAGNTTKKGAARFRVTDYEAPADEETAEDDAEGDRQDDAA